MGLLFTIGLIAALSATFGHLLAQYTGRRTLLGLSLTTLTCLALTFSLDPTQNWLLAHGCEGNLLKGVRCPDDLDTRFAFGLVAASFWSMLALIVLVPATFAALATAIFNYFARQ